MNTPPTGGLERGQRGIQSVEVGGQLLLALAHHGRPLPLKDLAREAGMSPAKAHPYLVSFQKIGLVAQETGGGRYGLGPLALQMGLIGLQQYDPVRLATERIDELAQRHDQRRVIGLEAHCEAAQLRGGGIRVIAARQRGFDVMQRRREQRPGFRIYRSRAAKLRMQLADERVQVLVCHGRRVLCIDRKVLAEYRPVDKRITA